MTDRKDKKTTRQFGVSINRDLARTIGVQRPVGDPARVQGSQQPLKSELMPAPKKPKPKS